MFVDDRAPSAAPQPRSGLYRAGQDARAGLLAASRHARPLHGVLGWWAVTSFGLLSVFVAALVLLWPGSLHTFGGATLGSWLLFAAFARFGGGQVLRARYGGPLLLQAGAGALALAGAVVLPLGDLAPTTGSAIAALGFGVAAAVDAAGSGRLPILGRDCLRVRAACGMIAAIAVAAAPVTGLVVAAAIVGLGEVFLAVRLLPEVERLARTAAGGPAERTGIPGLADRPGYDEA